MFAEVAALGSRLLWLHTYGERFVPPGQVRGRLPAGRAKSIKGIGSAPGSSPEAFAWIEDAADPGTGVLQVREGTIGPVSRAVWEFSVSGYEVLKAWLAFRMRVRSGRKSSVLDEIRPQSWDVVPSNELRELIWVLGATVEAQPKLNELFQRVVAGPVTQAELLPQPAEAERLPPGEDSEGPAQLSLT